MNTAKNIKIAEYIEMQKTELGWFDNEEVLVKVEVDNTFDVLKFDSDWNWLSAVMAWLSLSRDREADKDYDVVCYDISDAILDNDIPKAYNALVLYVEKMTKEI